MTWTRLPDDFTDRPDMLRVGRSARLLHVEALVWCNRLLTDGELPVSVVRRITDADDPDHDIAELVREGLWVRLDEQGWQIDWSGQEKATTVEQRREDNNARQRRYDDRRRRHAKGDHSACDPRFCPKAANASDDASSDASSDGLPSRPVPSRPLGRDRDRDREDGSAASDSSLALAASSATPSGEAEADGWTPPTYGTPPPGVIPEVDGVPIGPGYVYNPDDWKHLDE